jgi:hypothetical protein
MDFKSFYFEIQDTQVDLLHQDASVHQPSDLSDLLGGSTCMDVDVDCRNQGLWSQTSEALASEASTGHTGYDLELHLPLNPTP